MTAGLAFEYIDSAVAGGSCIVSAESATVVALVKEAVKAGHSATFYVSHLQYSAIRAWYWTPERRVESGLEEVGADEKMRIEARFGIRIDGFCNSNRINCSNCGHMYGAFEFIQQGIREHGPKMIESVFRSADSAVVKVNPRSAALCPECGHDVSSNHEGAAPTPNVIGGRGPGKHYYEFFNYGCCILSF
ncbi:hypothetical protein [Cryptosporangium phraense]|uniref:Uncharacterized protein n=1 Tax=Cryptosporangium phraense TaxID=2593070 RepID=A0A545AX32_9ACTN|nr:hypothetical protein [Cryptosporangium phraense]TQS45889.1 hypothetical protein FL583_05135 [Cryptosporangium phraense]